MTTLKAKREKSEQIIREKTGAQEIHVCMADDMHPYNCNGMYGGNCIHCEGVVEDGHDPNSCALCNWNKE